MKAAYYEKNGTASDVLIIGEKPMPVPASGEVLVRLHTSGVNPSDVKSRMGRPLPGAYVIPHSDGAGIIEMVGEGVPASRVGERVWVWNGQWQRACGTAAEFICLPEIQAVPLPDAVGFDVGACLGIPLLTAIQAVEFAKGVDAKSVLVTGAGSSVGHYITQIASLADMKVIATASERRATIVAEAGARHIVDYRSGDLAAKILESNGGQGVDAILDMDFSSTAALLARGVLKSHGSVICYGSNTMSEIAVPFRDLLFNSYALKFFLVYELTRQQRKAAIAEADRLLESGCLQTRIDSRFGLEDTVKAHERVESGAALGNVVLEVVPG